MRMTSRVKQPTAAVTMTNTWPWSDAMSEAEDSGEGRVAGGNDVGGQAEKGNGQIIVGELNGKRERIKYKAQVRVMRAVRMEKRKLGLMVGRISGEIEQIFIRMEPQ